MGKKGDKRGEGGRRLREAKHEAEEGKKREGKERRGGSGKGFFLMR